MEETKGNNGDTSAGLKSSDYVREGAVRFVEDQKKAIVSSLDNLRFRWHTYIGYVFVCTMCLFLYSKPNIKTPENIAFELVFPISIGSLLGLLVYMLVIDIQKSSLQTKLKDIEIQVLHLGTERLQESIQENFFTKLVQINFKYLDQYYLQTQQQANRSFALSRVASLSGFLIIILGVILMFFGKTEPAYVTTTAGIISEAIAALFFYLYNKTVLKMSQYHQKLVATQNINLALKIAEEMNDEARMRVQEQLIDRLTSDINKYLLSDAKD